MDERLAGYRADDLAGQCRVPAAERIVGNRTATRPPAIAHACPGAWQWRIGPPEFQPDVRERTEQAEAISGAAYRGRDHGRRQARGRPAPITKKQSARGPR